MKLFYLYCMLYLSFDVARVCFGNFCPSADCPQRNLTASDITKRQCRRSCDPDAPVCNSGLECVCANECGFSCVRLTNQCPAPPAVDDLQNVERIVIYKLIEVNETTSCYVPRANQKYKFSDYMEYQCKTGYYLQYPSRRIYCTARKSWTYYGENNCIRACHPRNLLEATRNGMTCVSTCNFNSDCSPGEHCDCDDVCGRSCINQDVDCGIAPAINNTEIEYVGEGFDRTAYYSCREGYYVSEGTTSRKCSAGGNWSGVPIVCKRVTCQDPFDAITKMSGEIVNWTPPPYYVGHNLTFSCRSFQLLRGSRSRVCMNNGLWSGRETICDDIDVSGRCLHPGVPIGGRLFGNSFAVGRTVTFTCNNNYVLVGDAEQECLFFHEWSGIRAPKCIDPAIRDSSSSVVQKLLESTSNIRSSIPQLNIGRFISASFPPGHEIYFLFDLSRSVTDGSLNNSLTFAVKLVERLSANATGAVEYSILVFASEPKVIVSIVGAQPTPQQIIQEIINIGLNRHILREEIRSGTHTNLAIEELDSQLAFSYQQDDKTERQRHVFILTDGQHNEGSPPQRQVDILLTRMNPPTFYSITSCVECANLATGGEAYAELLGLAAGNPDNFILIDNFYRISELLDQITNATIDYSQCGQAGEVGSVRQQARVGRVVGAIEAATQSWPWQVAITRRFSSGFTSLENAHFIGGGSLINNQWVLTAAHLLALEDQERNWLDRILLTFGLHTRPRSITELLSPQVEVYVASEYYAHELYTPFFDYDIALIKVGTRYIQMADGGLESTNMGGWVNYTAFIRPVCLPCTEDNCLSEYLLQQNLITGNENATERCRIETQEILETGKTDKSVLAVVTGFGHAEERRFGQGGRAMPTVSLQQGLIKLLESEVCKDFTGSYIPWQGARIPYTNRMICAVSGIADEIVDTCQGDSGGPLVREVVYLDGDEEVNCWVQAGIVSWGWGCAQTITVNGIANTQVPGYYTNLMVLMDWVKSTIEGNS